MSPLPTADHNPQGPVRILHVDDEPGLADMVATFLEREDDQFDVETTTSASEGLDYLADTEFDCIISDYDMPGQNGIEFLETVREEYPDLPFILYTGKGSEEIASEAVSAGVTDYLQKESGSSQYTVLANRVKNAVEQYRAKRELETSQQRLSLFFDESPLGVIHWNEDLEFVRVNDTAEDILGYTEAELIGNSWEMIVPESDRESMADMVSDLLADEGGYHSINENVTKDGETIVCGWHNRVVTGDDGNIRAIFSQIQDITDEYRRQERRERQHNALLELSTDDAVASGDFETAVRRITETATDVLDVPRANVWLLDDDESDAVLTCVDHYDRPADSHDHGMELTPEKYPSYFEALETHRAIAADDAREDSRTAELAEYLDAHDIGALLDATLRAEGDVVGVVCHEHVGDARDWTDDELDFASDIADVIHRALRNHEQREQRRELERKDRAMDAAPIGITISDPAQDDNPLIYVNDRFTELTGYTEEEVLGSNCRFLQGGHTEQEPVARMREAIDVEEPVTVELRNYRKDGTEFWNRVSIAPVHNDEGEVTNYVGFQQDVTNEKERKRELKETNAILSTLFETLPAGILAEDTARNILTVNERLFELFEMPDTPEEVIGADCERLAEQVSDIFVDPDGFVERINELVANREPTDNEEFALTDGRTFERSYRPIELSDGEGHLWVYRDITERKEQEAERVATIEFLQSLYDVATDRELTPDEKITKVLELGPEKLGLPYGHLTRIERMGNGPEDGTQTVIEASGDHELLQPDDSCPLSHSYCRKTIEQDGLLEIQDALAAGWAGDPAYGTFSLECYIGTAITVNDELYGTVFFASDTPREEPFTDADRTFVRLMSQLVSYELERKQAISE